MPVVTDDPHNHDVLAHPWAGNDVTIRDPARRRRVGDPGQPHTIRGLAQRIDVRLLELMRK